MRADHARFVDALLGAGLTRRPASRCRGQDHYDALRAVHHMRIGDDVSVGIDDYAGSHPVLADDVRGVGAAVFARDGAVAGDEDLDHGRRDAGRELGEGATELPQHPTTA